MDQKTSDILSYVADCANKMINDEWTKEDAERELPRLVMAQEYIAEWVRNHALH